MPAVLLSGSDDATAQVWNVAHAVVAQRDRWLDDAHNDGVVAPTMNKSDPRSVSQSVCQSVASSIALKHSIKFCVQFSRSRRARAERCVVAVQCRHCVYRLRRPGRTSTEKRRALLTPSTQTLRMWRLSMQSDASPIGAPRTALRTSTAAFHKRRKKTQKFASLKVCRAFACSLSQRALAFSDGGIKIERNRP